MNAPRKEDPRHRHRLLRVFRWLGVVALVCVWPLLAGAQPVRFKSVQAWRGTFIAKAHQYTSEEIAAGGQRLGSVVIYYDAAFTADFLLDEFEDEPATWSGRIIKPALDADYRGVKKLLINPKEGNTLLEEESFNTSGTPYFGEQPVVELLFHRERGWSFNMSTPRRDAQLTETFTLTPKKGPVIREEKQRKIAASAESGTATKPYPAQGLVLFTGAEKSGGPRDIPGSIAGDITWEYTVYLEPTSMEELRLEIEEPSDYPAWRPETTAGADPGKPLGVTARVVSATGGNPQTRVERFIWQLESTSQEPGVTLNFPVGATDNQLDLELDADGQYFVLKDKKQTMERAVQTGWSDMVKVVPYDWGGWSTLQVTAVLVDGRRVTGKVKGKSERGLRIPKRAADSHIADGWKAQHKNGADNLDDEKIEGQKDDGDGFALYEEYRGWMVNGEHRGGDPKEKDFFVLNLIGGDAENGINLFEALSQLTVHSKLRPTEMSEATRLMNGNHRRGARQVDQHGVWVKTFASKSELGDDGALTVINESGKGRAGRPGTVSGIGILARDNTESVFNKPFNLPAQQTISVYDRAIAHELLHSVGVEHHGSNKDKTIDLRFIALEHPLNLLGQPYFATMEGVVVRVNLEDGQDLAALYQSGFGWVIRQARVDLLGRYLAKARADFAVNQSYHQPSKYASPEAQAEVEFFNDQATAFTRHGLVGVEQGAHSGDQDCVMRYYFADFYEAAGGKDALFVVALGTEQIGLQICHSGEGTGINALGHSPQSRYGHAATGAGNCFEQICPNDAIPPREVK